MDQHLSFVTTEEEKTDPGSSFHGLLMALRRRMWIIVVCMIVAPAAAYGISKAQTKEYTASAQLLFHQSGLQQQLTTGSTPPAAQPASTGPARPAPPNAAPVNPPRAPHR